MADKEKYVIFGSTGGNKKLGGGERMTELKEHRSELKVYSKKDLLEIFPFGRTKLQQLLTAGVLPVVKVGKSYLTSEAQIQRWLFENTGKEIFY